MKKIALLSILSMACTVAFGQWGMEEMSDKPDWKERVFTGGGFGAAFGSYYDYVSVSPLIGYSITQKLAAGIQVQYRYTNYKGYTQTISTNDWGVSPFVRYSLFGPIFLHAEYEYLNYQYPTSNGEKFRRDFNSFMAGGGFFQPIGRRAGFYALALYNFSYDDLDVYSPYNSPLVLRVGITAGF
jgi:hypothetical protein